MAGLPEMHRVFVEQFVEEANKTMEKIRNSRSLKKAIFTEANLREMAINWTTTLKDMEEIEDINVESVKMWGKKFLPIVQKYFANYEVAVDESEDRDIDKNHQNVIDLCSEDEDDEYGMNESDEEAILEAEQGSKYFQQQSKAASPRKGHSNWTFPSGATPATRRSARAGDGFPSRGKTRRKSSRGRRSGSSASGQSYARVTKRKTSAAAKKLKAPSDLFSTFGHHGSGKGGASGAGGSGGIRMMPT
jgi:bloom syndrome protein